MRTNWYSVVQVLFLILLAKFSLGTNYPKETPKSSASGLRNFKDTEDIWVGYPKSPYTQKTPTLRPPSTTSTKAPTSTQHASRRVNYKIKRRKKKQEYDNYDLEPDSTNLYYPDPPHDDQPQYAIDDDGSDEDYQDTYYQPKRRARTKFSMSSSPPSSSYASSPSDYHSSTSFANAFTPKIAQYVVHEPKKYSVRRIQPQAIFTVKPTFDKDLYHSASSSVGRRLDPPDYDDRENFAGFGPQNSFPPRQVMDKIANPGDRQPCHGPDCHQHHKGLVRFYWKRVIYPNDEFGNRIRPNRNRNRIRNRRRRRRRRRNRDRLRSPSANLELYTPGRDEDEDDDDDDKESEDDDDYQEETEQNAKRHDMWLPDRAYGHDLDEGSNYSANEKKVYRDKRYAFKKWQRQRQRQKTH